MNTVLQAVRKNVGLTQVEVAKQAQIAEISYQRIEYGTQRPSLITAQLIAKTLNTTVEKLFPIDYLLAQADNTKAPDCNQVGK